MKTKWTNEEIGWANLKKGPAGEIKGRAKIAKGCV